MDRPVLARKTLNTQRARVDRFVMSRDPYMEMRRRISRDKNNTMDIWNVNHRHQTKYKNYLNKAFGFEPAKSSEDEPVVQPWPCTPRKKSFLTSIDSILDLPAYSYAILPELIDWSSTNLLVAALGTRYYMFSWSMQKVIDKGITSSFIRCCKFDPRGEMLLLGTGRKTVEIHNNLWKQWTQDGQCACSDVGPLCSITAVDWSPTGNSFVTGCTRGEVNTFARTAYLINTWRDESRLPILAVRVSPDTRFVAVNTINFVYVLIWPSLEYHSVLDSISKSNHIVKTINWHPWKSALLAVGAVSQFKTTIALWNIPSTKYREINLGNSHHILDAMLFSHRTGELVISLWNAASSIDPRNSQLIVMSDPYTVVDQSGEKRGLDRVRTMVFSPDGTKLATATADEDLIIWNFLPEDKRKYTKKSKRFSALPVYIDEITNGYVLR